MLTDYSRTHVPNVHRVIYEYTSCRSRLHRPFQQTCLTFNFTQHARRLLLRRPLVCTQDRHLPGETPNVQTVSSITGCHPLQSVSHPDMLLFALRRFKDKSSGRSSLFSFAEISEITAFHLDG